MAELQRQNSFVVELTDEGVREIQKHKNIYTDDTRPLALKDREWSVKNYVTLWTGILVSVAVYTMASALLAAGLTWYQALFICVLGHSLVLIPSILLGKFGSRYGDKLPDPFQNGIRPERDGDPDADQSVHGLPVVRHPELDRKRGFPCDHCHDPSVLRQYSGM